MKQAGKLDYEGHFIPSGQLESIFRQAEQFRASEKASAVRLDHFLFALLLDIAPYLTESVLKVSTLRKRRKS